MRRLVLAMAHPVVAEPHRQKELRVDHGRPELDVGVLFFQPPGVIAALDNPALDRALKIDAPKFVLTRHPGDHAELEPAARAGSRRNLDPRLKRRLDQRGFARRGADFVQRHALRPDASPVTGQPEQVLSRPDRAQFPGGRRKKNHHPGAIGHHSPRDLAGALDSSCYFPSRDPLESRLRMRDVEVRAEPYRMRLCALGCGLAIAPGTSIRLARANQLSARALLRA